MEVSAETGAADLEQQTGARGQRRLEVALAACALAVIAQNTPWRYPSLPDSFIDAPGVGGRLLTVLPITTGLVVLACVGLVVAAGFLAVGRSTRWASLAVAVLGFYALGVPQLYGKVNHYHHILWVAVVVALGLRPAVTLRAVTLLLGFVYLFPGVAKLLAGPDWWWSDNLHNIALRTRGIHDWSGPMFPEWASVPLAVATIVFEIGIGAALLSRWRKPALIVGAGFHIGIGLTMGIWFYPLLAFYPALWLAEPVEPQEWEIRRVLPLVVAAVIAGTTFTNRDWPVAAYPLFDKISSEGGETLHLYDADGERYVDRWGWMASERRNGLERLLIAEPWRVGEPVTVA